MAVLSYVPGYKTSLWKFHSSHKPDQCPGCACSGSSLLYIGLARQYEPGWQARMYQCAECSTWVDCVYPDASPERSQRQRPLADQHFSHMLL